MQSVKCFETLHVMFALYNMIALFLVLTKERNVDNAFIRRKCGHRCPPVTAAYSMDILLVTIAIHQVIYT